jgi:hypothetical protein
MPGSIDKIESVIDTLKRVVHGDRMRLDGNAFFTLQIHRIQQLILHLALFDRLGHFQQPIGQSCFSVVDVRNNAEIPNVPLHGKDSLIFG